MAKGTFPLRSVWLGRGRTRWQTLLKQGTTVPISLTAPFLTFAFGPPNNSITGVANVSFAAMSLSATAFLGTITGLSSNTLGTMVLGSTGSVKVQGTFNSTLDATTLSGIAQARVMGTSGLTLGPAILSASGVGSISGFSAVTLAPIVLSANGTSNLTGSSSLSLTQMTLNATGNQSVFGQGVAQFQMTLAGSAEGRITGEATLGFGTSLNALGYVTPSTPVNGVPSIILTELFTPVINSDILRLNILSESAIWP